MIYHGRHLSNSHFITFDDTRTRKDVYKDIFVKCKYRSEMTCSESRSELKDPNLQRGSGSRLDPQPCSLLNTYRVRYEYSYTTQRYRTNCLFSQLLRLEISFKKLTYFSRIIISLSLDLFYNSEDPLTLVLSMDSLSTTSVRSRCSFFTSSPVRLKKSDGRAPMLLLLLPEPTIAIYV
jgi:hypothetical protein